MKDFERTSLKSGVIKRSVVIGGHKTAVSLEDAFWNDFKEIAHLQQKTVSMLVTEIDQGRQQTNLSSAIRLFVLDQIHRHGNPWQYSRARYSRVLKISLDDQELDAAWPI